MGNDRRRRLRARLTRQEQMSEALVLSLVLAFSGGFQDAYTYMVRDGVFANAQTGNIVLMSTLFMEGRWEAGLRYLLPVCAFALGVWGAETIRRRLRQARAIHWRQGVLLSELGIMVLVGLVPAGWSIPANILVSLSCAMQVQAFRTVGGNAYASTMCIGNLRSGTAALAAYFRDRDRKDLTRAGAYFGVIAAFALGAGAGGVLSPLWGTRTIWLACLFLTAAFLLMDLDRAPA